MSLAVLLAKTLSCSHTISATCFHVLAHGPEHILCISQNVAPPESVHKLFTHPWCLHMMRLTGTNPSPACLCVRQSCTRELKMNYSHLNSTQWWMVIPNPQKCVCIQYVYICLAAATHLSVIPSSVPSIIPSIWQQRPVSKTFFLASAFKNSDREDSQPQEPHIIRSLVHAYREVLA